MSASQARDILHKHAKATTMPGVSALQMQRHVDAVIAANDTALSVSRPVRNRMSSEQAAMEAELGKSVNTWNGNADDFLAAYRAKGEELIVDGRGMALVNGENVPFIRYRNPKTGETMALMDFPSSVVVYPNADH